MGPASPPTPFRAKVSSLETTCTFLVFLDVQNEPRQPRATVTVAIPSTAAGHVACMPQDLILFCLAWG